MSKLAEFDSLQDIRHDLIVVSILRREDSEMGMSAVRDEFLDGQAFRTDGFLRKPGHLPRQSATWKSRDVVHSQTDDAASGREFSTEGPE